MPDNPQSDGPGVGPGMNVQVPQASPAADHGPDSHHMPTMGQQLNRPATDYEGRYKGLNDWVNKEFNGLRGTVEQLGQQMTQLMETLRKQPEPQAQAPAPASSPEKAEQPTGPDVLDLAIQSKKAQQYRDMLIAEYEEATGLPLSQFRKHIDVVPPALKDSGELDDSGQRAVIDDFVNSLKGLKGDAQREVLKGHTPGSAPSAPMGATADGLVKELHDIMALMGDEAWDVLSPADQAKTESRYFELLADSSVQERHEGNLQPSMGVGELSRKVRDLTRTVADLKGKLPANFG